MDNYKVLVVDDDPVVQFLHRQLVLKAGISSEVWVFNNGKEAIQYLLSEAKADCPHLVLLDINMPVMDGWEMLDILKLTQTPVDVIVVSSSINKEDREKALTYKMVSAYLSKPLKSSSEITKLMIKDSTGL